ncbi:MAG: hypothetical protein HFJ27_03460 [Clostridia bacterium]|nr:hypothetical protein [Clostridia bacterium]
MKKQKKKIMKMIILWVAFFMMTIPCYATQEEILQTQSDMLNIKGFVQQANQYTKEAFDGIDVETLLNDAIKGKIDNGNIITKILNLFGKEIKDTIMIVREYSYNNCHT